MIEAAIFDFDGVIADSLDLVLSIGNHYLKMWRKKPISKEFYRSHDVTNTYNSYGINPVLELFLFWKIRSAIHNNLRLIPVHEHIVPVVKTLSEEAPLSVLTSNSRHNVIDFLEVHRIHNYFLEIHGGFLAFNKDRGLTEMLVKSRLEPKKVVYIGDEPRDVRTAKAAGVNSIAVDWGYADRSLLLESEPDLIASTSEQLLRGIQSF